MTIELAIFIGLIVVASIGLGALVEQLTEKTVKNVGLKSILAIVLVIIIILVSLRISSISTETKQEKFIKEFYNK